MTEKLRYRATYYLRSGTYRYAPRLSPSGFFSPFETGIAPWRYYRNVLCAYDDRMISTVRCDTWTALLRWGLITC